MSTWEELWLEAPGLLGGALVAGLVALTMERRDRRRRGKGR
jgi:hypothetical protein